MMKEYRRCNIYKSLIFLCIFEKNKNRAGIELTMNVYSGLEELTVVTIKKEDII